MRSNKLESGTIFLVDAIKLPAYKEAEALTINYLSADLIDKRKSGFTYKPRRQE